MDSLITLDVSHLIFVLHLRYNEILFLVIPLREMNFLNV